ncbi:MAG: glycoside hydrolase family 13 protein [Dysosmobacter sp.]|nr:glycoside hydrolase family 13 protein [Dysosmobacter sp.]MDY3866924.1 glycoside hydrolase family 13 protein [Dysosmobacter sp.]
MLDPFVFDSRSESCKKPYGAVPCGTAVSYTVRPLRREGWSRCVLVTQREFSGQTAELELPCTGQDGDRNRFSGIFSAPAEPELVWYWFRLSREDGSSILLDRSGYHGGENVQSWQLTVYEESSTPAWFGCGVVYQIFPDRFCRLELPDPAGMVGSRTIHENWSNLPDWRPDAQGEVRNCDFFGGSLQGILSKLDDLADFGVTVLYLNPVFESASNHRYNTADYRAIDPMLGTEDDFHHLCQEAKRRGIRVILDGVFNHTGSQSRYFNADGFYSDTGAAQSPDSPYYHWYSFHPWPADYDAWWGIRTLPAVREDAPDYRDFIIRGQDSVVRHWLRAGASGWRLDVADELPDDFIGEIRTAMEETAPDSFLLGEVWEDATTKIAYSMRRRYLLGQELHGVMNYPFRTALIAYLLGGDADEFRETLESLRENYPPHAFYSLMNFLSTHDTPRILTVLGADHVPDSKEERAVFRLSPARRQLGLKRLRLAALVLFTFPGAPTVYYGDEAGMEGWEDPFNRAGYPWGQEDFELKSFFSSLVHLRREQPALQTGQLHWRWTAGSLLVFARELDGQLLTTVVNAADTPQTLTLPWFGDTARDLLSSEVLSPADNVLPLTLLPHQGLLLTT